MATGGNNRINFQVGFNVDKSSLNQVSAAFQKLRNFKFSDFKGTKEQLIDIKVQAQQVENALNNAFNPKLNSINIKQFQSELQSQNLSIEQIHSNFSRLGAVGQNAFNSMSTSVLTSNLQLKQTSSLVQNLGTTLMNTVKWTVASSAIRAFTGSISQAFTYVKSLDSSLNDIRIVTKDSADQMANFAVQANRAASQLGRSTLDYTKAALTFYQQGLDDEAVQARTEAVLKAQNITGAGAQMADYLTAVWNGYKVANEQALNYVDKLAAVADSSASNMSQIAIAMSKVSSAANILGVDVDNLAAQIATIVATTRQAPESVGNALKTVYARINDISTGADDAEVSLGNYSKAMLKVGVSVLDSNGKLRNTGDVIDEIGEKWSSLSREQQIFLARTMAGQRQYNKLITLFDNWSKYTDLVTISMQSQGAVEQKNAIYMESLAAHTEKLGAAQQRLKSSMVDSDSYKSMIDVATKGVTLFANFIQSIGGGGNALLMFGSILTQVFSGVIAKEINNVVTNMQNVKHNAQMVAARIEFLNAHTGQSGQDSTAARVLNDVKSIYTDITDQQKIQLDTLIKQQAEEDNKVRILREEVKQAEELKNKMAQAMNVSKNSKGNYNWQQFGQKIDIAHGALDNLKTSLDKVDGSANKLTNKKILAGLKESVLEANNALGGSNQKLAEVAEKIKYLSTGSTQVMNKSQLQAHVNSIKAALQDARQELNLIDETRTDNLQANLNEAQKKAKAAANATKEFTDALHSQVNIQNITRGVAGIGQLASGITSLINLTKIWGNENLSTGEKILQTFTGLSMSIGMITSALGNMRKGWQGLSAIVSAFGQKTVVMQALQTAGNVSLAESEKLATNEAVKQAAAQSGVSTTAFAQVVAMKMAEVANLEQAIAATKAAFANQTLAKSFGKILIAIAPYVAAIAAIGAAIYIAIKAENKHADAMKQAAQAAKDFEDSVSKYNQLSKSLNQLTQGTDQWNKKLQQSNDLVLDLINKFPELINYVTNVNGKLSISEAGFEKMQQSINQQVTNAGVSNANMQSNSRNAAIDYQASNLAKEIYRPAGSGGSISREASIQEVKAVAKAFNQALLKNNGQINDRLIQEISSQIKVSENVVKALVQNSNGLKELGNSIEENNKVTQLAYQAQAANALQTNQIYKNTSDQIDKAIMEKVAGADLQSVIDTVKKTWQDKLTGSGISKASGNQNEIYQETLKALNDAGYNFKQATDGNGVLGTDSNRRLVFNNGEEDKQYRAEEIASMIAASEALKDLGNSASETQKALQNLQGLDNNVQDAIKQLMLGGDFSNMSKGQLEDLQGQESILKDYWEKNKEVLKSAGYENADVFAKAFTTNLDNATEGFNQVVRNKSLEVKQAFSSLDLDKDVSLSLSNQIATSLQDAFNKGGAEGLKNLQNFYSQITDFNAFDKVASSLDFNTITAEDFMSALYEAGAATNVSREAIQAYINAQRENANLTTDQLRANYKTVHDIIDKIKDDSVLSPQDAAKLQQAGIELDNYFTQALDGTWKLKTSAEEFYEYANNQSLEGFKSKIEELKEEAAKGLDWNKNKYSAQQGASFQNLSSSAGLVNYDTGENTVDQAKVNTQIQFLELLGKESQVKAEIEAQGYATYEQAIKLAKEVSKYRVEWENVDSVTKQHLAQIENIQAGIEAATEKEKEFALDSDVKKEQWEDLSQYLEEYADKLDDVDDSVKDNKKVAQELAHELLRYDAALESVGKNYQTWEKQLTSGAIQDQVKAGNELQNVYSDLLDLPFENLSPDFTQSITNLNDLKAAMQGDQEAYNRLADAARQEIAVNVGFNDENFQNEFNQLYSQLYDTPFEDLEIGASLDDEEFLRALSEMITAAGMTAEQAQDYLASMGIDAEVHTSKTPMKSYEQVVADGGYWKNEESTTTVVPADGQQEPYPVTIQRAVWVPIQEVNRQQYEAEFQAASLQVKSAHKKSGGGFKYRNSTHGGGSGKKSGGSGKGKKGGSKKSSKPANVKSLKSKPIYDKKDLEKESQLMEDVYDPYEQITKQYQRQKQLLEKITAQQDKLSGKDRLKNLQLQNKELQKQNKNLLKRQQISKDKTDKGTTANLRAQLKKKFGSNIGFDSDGQIKSTIDSTNWAIQQYNQSLQKSDQVIRQAKEKANQQQQAAAEKYEAWRKAYNKKSAKQQQAEYKKLSKKIREQYDSAEAYHKAIYDQEVEKAKEAAQKVIDKQEEKQKKAKDTYDARIKLLEEYQQRLEEDKKFYEEYIDNLREIIENKLSQIEIKVQFKIEDGDFERQYLNFQNKFIKQIGDKQFRKKAKAAARNLFSYLDSDELAQSVSAMNEARTNYMALKNNRDKYINKKTLTAQDYEMLGITEDAWKQIKTKDERAALIDEAISKSYEQLKQFTTTVQDNLMQMQQYADQIKDTLLSAYDQLRDNQDDVLKQYDRINSAIQHGVKLSQMIFGEKAYAQAEKFQADQLANDKKQLKKLAQYKKYWQQIYNTTSDAELKQKALENMNDFTDQLQSKVEKCIEEANKLLQIRINKTIDAALEKFATLGTEGNQSQWDHLKEFDDAFLDVAESRMGIAQIERLYNDVGETLKNNTQQQKKFNDFQNKQINLLKNKKNLTQYDLDRAKAALEVEKARYALEQARDQKTTLRLRRDSQGNYTYQYIAQEEELEDKTAQLEEKIANLYKLDKDAYIKSVEAMEERGQKYLETMTKLQQEYNQAINAGQEERAEKIKARMQMEQQEYKRMWDALAEDNQVIFNTYLPQSYAESMGMEFSTAGQAIQHMKESVDIFNSQAQEYINAINGEGGLIEAFDKTVQSIEKQIKHINTSILNTLDVEGISAAADGSIQLVAGISELAAAEQDMISGYEQIIKQTQSQISSITQLLQQTDTFMQSLRETGGILKDILASYKQIQKQNAFDDNGLDGITSGKFSTETLATLKNYINAMIEQFGGVIAASEQASTYATGGYTGEWGEIGKLAYLHEKELVLNANDTANLLTAVSAIRDITSRMSIDSALNGLAASQSGLLNTLYNQHSQLDQNVHIEASFPNVTNHLEIERAFQNLVNIASMHASQKG